MFVLQSVNVFSISQAVASAPMDVSLNTSPGP